MQDNQQFHVDNPEICGYLNQSEDNVSNLLRTIKEDGSPVFLRADHVLGYTARIRPANNASFQQRS